MHRSNFYTVWMEKLFVSRDNVLEDGNLAQGRERSQGTGEDNLEKIFELVLE